MFAILCQTQLSQGEQPWTEVGGGVDSGKMVGSGTFITVKSTPSEEVSDCSLSLLVQPPEEGIWRIQGILTYLLLLHLLQAAIILGKGKFEADLFSSDKHKAATTSA